MWGTRILASENVAQAALSYEPKIKKSIDAPTSWAPLVEVMGPKEMLWTNVYSLHVGSVCQGTVGPLPWGTMFMSLISPFES